MKIFYLWMQNVCNRRGVVLELCVLSCRSLSWLSACVFNWTTSASSYRRWETGCPNSMYTCTHKSSTTHSLLAWYCQRVHVVMNLVCKVLRPAEFLYILLFGCWWWVDIHAILQDMVVEFAKMNIYQLLEETEKAVSEQGSVFARTFVKRPLT